jgi:hypothetical protein
LALGVENVGLAADAFEDAACQDQQADTGQYFDRALSTAQDVGPIFFSAELERAMIPARISKGVAASSAMLPLY